MREKKIESKMIVKVQSSRIILLSDAQTQKILRDERRVIDTSSIYLGYSMFSSTTVDTDRLEMVVG